MRTNWGLGSVLLLLAVICFILAAFGASFMGLNFTAIGLAFFAGAFLLRE